MPRDEEKAGSAGQYSDEEEEEEGGGIDILSTTDETTPPTVKGAEFENLVATERPRQRHAGAHIASTAAAGTGGARPVGHPSGPGGRG